MEREDGIVLYDDGCRLCRGAVGRLRAADPAGRFRCERATLHEGLHG